MDTTARTWIELQSRRQFLRVIGNGALCAASTSIALPAWALREPDTKEALSYLTSRFARIRQSEGVPILVNDAVKAEVPLQFPTAKDIISRDFVFRWQLTEALTLIDESELRNQLLKEPARLVLSTEVPAAKQRELIDLLITNKEPLVPKLAEITPLQLRSVPTTAPPSKESCGLVVLEIILTAIVGVTVAKEKIEALLSYFVEPVRCMEPAVKARDWEAFKRCIIEFLIRLVAAKTLDIIRKELGEQAVKRILRFMTSRLLPVVGAAFALVSLILVAKDNWGRLERSCTK